MAKTEDRKFWKKFVRVNQKHGRDFQPLKERTLKHVRQVRTKVHDFDYWERFYLVETSNTRKAVAWLLEQSILIFPEQTEFYSDYDCTGKSFISTSDIRPVGDSFTLIIVRWSVDC